MSPTDSGCARPNVRKLGVMVTAGFRNVATADDLRVARSIEAVCVEVLPNWRDCPDPGPVGREICDAGQLVHSVHGGWGSNSIVCERIDLGSGDERVRGESVDDVRRCIDWAVGVGARHLIVHPGGLSASEEMEIRAESLVRSLRALAEAAPGESFVCVENMPRGVWPGSEMGDLARIVERVGRSEVALVVDTGHAAIVEDAASQTKKAGARLASTHVHDNDGKQDSHKIPGSGIVDWSSWITALDEIGYGGPVMLECIRDLRGREEAELKRFGEKIRRMLRTG